MQKSGWKSRLTQPPAGTGQAEITSRDKKRTLSLARWISTEGCTLGNRNNCSKHKKLPLTAISEFAEAGKSNPLFADLDKIVAKSKGLWSIEAEGYLLEYAPGI